MAWCVSRSFANMSTAFSPAWTADNRSCSIDGDAYFPELMCVMTSCCMKGSTKVVNSCDNLLDSLFFSCNSCCLTIFVTHWPCYTHAAQVLAAFVIFGFVSYDPLVNSAVLPTCPLLVLVSLLIVTFIVCSFVMLLNVLLLLSWTANSRTISWSVYVGMRLQTTCPRYGLGGIDWRFYHPMLLSRTAFPVDTGYALASYVSGWSVKSIGAAEPLQWHQTRKLHLGHWLPEIVGNLSV